VIMRVDQRRTDLAVRRALGAAPWRIVRGVVAEAMLLAVAGTVLGAWATSVLLPALLSWIPDGLPRVSTVRLNASVALIAGIWTVATATLVAIAPAVTMTREPLWRALAEGRRGGSSGRHHWRRAIVTSQVAAAVVGLMTVALVVGSLQRLSNEAAKLATGELTLVPLVMPHARYDDLATRRRFVTTLSEAVQADARVTSVTAVNVTPFAGTGWDVPFLTAEGQSDVEAAGNPALNLEEIHPGYFRTFEVGIVRGRSFTDADGGGAPRVAILSVDVADRLWPNQDPLGKRVKWGTPASDAEWLTIVGVATPTRYRELAQRFPSLYVPAAQMNGAASQLVVRTAMPVGELSTLVAARVLAIDPLVGVKPLRPFGELVSRPLARPRFYAGLMTAFGATGLTLTMVGLYGVVAAGVRARRRELGVRLALGADRIDIQRLVLGDGARLVGTGVLLGLVVSVLVAGTLRSLLYGIPPIHPPALIGAVGGVLLTALLAIVVPLQRAGAVNPAEVLRAE
jgi:putative ABC transport system permease protein